MRIWPTGFPSLRLIGRVDCSLGERYEWTQVGLCRDPSGTMQQHSLAASVISNFDTRPVLG